MRTLTATLLMLLTASALAAESGEFAPPPPPPPLTNHPADEAPAAGNSNDAANKGEQDLQPEVTIIKRKEETIEEYRISGRLYMVKITPSKGYPYYLIDTNGDGSLDTRRNELDNPPVVQWRIFNW